MSLSAQDSRLAKIGRLLLWEGRVSRGRLINEFDLSDTRASEWLREFREAYADWLRWDSKQRAYVATAVAYKRVGEVWRDTLTPMLAEMLTPCAGSASGEPSIVPWDFNRPDPLFFSRVNLAIADRLQVSAFYKSIGHPEPHARTIEPHSLMLAGRRWRARGYCIETGDFRDFVLGRMSNLRVLPTSQSVDPATDTAWFTTVPVHFVAHPKLTYGQQLVVRDEFFRGTGGWTEHCRASQVKYLIQELHAATSPEVQIPPEYSLAVEGVDDLSRWLGPNEDMSPT
jgi:hypothetical protein